MVISNLKSYSVLYPFSAFNACPPPPSALSNELFAARQMGRVFGCQVHIPQKHQGKVLGHLLVSNSLRCGRLQLFYSRNHLFLRDAWCHLHCQSPYANHWLLIEFYSMKMSYARLLLRTNFVDFFFWFLIASCSSVYSLFSFSIGGHSQGREYAIL